MLASKIQLKIAASKTLPKIEFKNIKDSGKNAKTHEKNEIVLKVNLTADSK